MGESRKPIASGNFAARWPKMKLFFADISILTMLFNSLGSLEKLDRTMFGRTEETKQVSVVVLNVFVYRMWFKGNRLKRDSSN